MSKKVIIGIVIAAIIAIVAAIIIMMSGEKTAEPVAPEKQAVDLEKYDRTKDPEYTKTLHKQIAEQQKVGGALAAAQKAYDAAKAEDPNSAKTKDLEKKLEAAKLEVEKNRQVSMAIIRQRMLLEQAQKEKAAKGE